MVLSLEGASGPKVEHVTVFPCPPARVYQTATEHSKPGSTAISVASSWSTWSCRSAVHVNVTKDASNKRNTI